MKEYFPTAKDIAELNEAAEQLTPKAIKSEPLSKLVKATTFYKTLSKSNCPDCVDMGLEGITPKGKLFPLLNESKNSNYFALKWGC
jgi:ArsR family metal-binding transcriptional regulator